MDYTQEMRSWARNLERGAGGRDVRTSIAFFFGLIHGFGFANVLKELGLPRQVLGCKDYGMRSLRVNVTKIYADLKQ